MRFFLRSVACIVCVLALCGCNVALLSQNRKMYAKSIEYRYLAQETVKRVKKYVTDPIALDRARTFYQTAAADNDFFIAALEYAAKTNDFDTDIYDRFTALSGSYEQLADFADDTAVHLKISALGAHDMALCALDAGDKSKKALQELKAVLLDKTRVKEERIRAAIVLLDKQRWPDWPQI